VSLYTTGQDRPAAIGHRCQHRELQRERGRAVTSLTEREGRKRFHALLCIAASAVSRSVCVCVSGYISEGRDLAQREREGPVTSLSLKIHGHSLSLTHARMLAHSHSRTQDTLAHRHTYIGLRHHLLNRLRVCRRPQQRQQAQHFRVALGRNHARVIL